MAPLLPSTAQGDGVSCLPRGMQERNPQARKYLQRPSPHHCPQPRRLGEDARGAAPPAGASKAHTIHEASRDGMADMAEFSPGAPGENAKQPEEAIQGLLQALHLPSCRTGGLR
ncbi:hypothetical protein P7K49_005845 [Saguinus oedipus]|uniref:Uncharacterized protein n=1 Tax=Saguinus oedipus TaxID=9490 RepID=A0ABQ9W0R4_SAGOE|nr:hypothetical protein P7K49_005845 [Saguinus oedipus]